MRSGDETSSFPFTTNRHKVCNYNLCKIRLIFCVFLVVSSFIIVNFDVTLVLDYNKFMDYTGLHIVRVVHEDKTVVLLIHM